MRLRLRNLLIRLACGLLNRFEHRLGWKTAGILLLLLRHTLSGTGHRLPHVLTPLVDDLLDPRLRLHNALHAGLIPIEHEQQIGCEFKTLIVTVGVCCTGQLIPIPVISLNFIN